VAATKVTIGNGKRALFWEFSWLDGMRPKDIAPLIFDISKKKKKCLISKAMDTEFWISQTNIQGGLTVEHIVQFTKLWEMAKNVQMDNDTPDKITWKLSNDGSYSSKSAYKLQFQIHVISLMPSLVWKPWAPSKCKFFAWLIIQN
jgi:hypothetical protein